MGSGGKKMSECLQPGYGYGTIIFVLSIIKNLNNVNQKEAFIQQGLKE